MTRRENSDFLPPARDCGARVLALRLEPALGFKRAAPAEEMGVRGEFPTRGGARPDGLRSGCGVCRRRGTGAAGGGIKDEGFAGGAGGEGWVPFGCGSLLRFVVAGFNDCLFPVCCSGDLPMFSLLLELSSEIIAGTAIVGGVGAVFPVVCDGEVCSKDRGVVDEGSGAEFGASRWASASFGSRFEDHDGR